MPVGRFKIREEGGSMKANLPASVACAFLFVFLAVVSIPFLVAEESSGTAEAGTSEVIGSEADDFIVSGSEDTVFYPGPGRNYLVGGPGNNEYRVDAGDSRNEISEVQGHNIVSFGAGISFFDISSGFMRSGDDLILNVADTDQQIVIKYFFSLANTITEFHFPDSQPLQASQLYGIFGAAPPSEERAPRTLRIESDASGMLEGTPGPDILIQDADVDRLWGLGGDDYLVAANGDVIFELGANDGKNLIFASTGYNIIQFDETVPFSDVASQLQKRDDDLILGNASSDAEVRVREFFSRQYRQRNSIRQRAGHHGGATVRRHEQPRA